MSTAVEILRNLAANAESVTREMQSMYQGAVTEVERLDRYALLFGGAEEGMGITGRFADTANEHFASNRKIARTNSDAINELPTISKNITRAFEQAKVAYARLPSGEISRWEDEAIIGGAPVFGPAGILLGTVALQYRENQAREEREEAAQKAVDDFVEDMILAAKKAQTIIKEVKTTSVVDIARWADDDGIEDFNFDNLARTLKSGGTGPDSRGGETNAGSGVGGPLVGGVEPSLGLTDEILPATNSESRPVAPGVPVNGGSGSGGPGAPGAGGPGTGSPGGTGAPGGGDRGGPVVDGGGVGSSVGGVLGGLAAAGGGVGLAGGLARGGLAGGGPTGWTAGPGRASSAGATTAGSNAGSATSTGSGWAGNPGSSPGVPGSRSGLGGPPPGGSPGRGSPSPYSVRAGSNMTMGHHGMGSGVGEEETKKPPRRRYQVPKVPEPDKPAQRRPAPAPLPATDGEDRRYTPQREKELRREILWYRRRAQSSAQDSQRFGPIYDRKMTLLIELLWQRTQLEAQTAAQEAAQAERTSTRWKRLRHRLKNHR